MPSAAKDDAAPAADASADHAAAAQQAAMTAQQAADASSAATADAKDHADRAEAAADKAVAAAPSSARYLFIGAIVNVSTVDDMDGQHIHAAIVTRFDGLVINATLFRVAGDPVSRQGLPFDDSDVPAGDCWFWPAA